jgi:hypothetical protein
MMFWLVFVFLHVIERKLAILSKKGPEEAEPNEGARADSLGGRAHLPCTQRGQHSCAALCSSCRTPEGARAQFKVRSSAPC